MLPKQRGQVDVALDRRMSVVCYVGRSESSEAVGGCRIPGSVPPVNGEGREIASVGELSLVRMNGWRHELKAAESTPPPLCRFPLRDVSGTNPTSLALLWCLVGGDAAPVDGELQPASDGHCELCRVCNLL